MGLLAFGLRVVLYCGSCAITLMVKGIETETSSTVIVTSLQILMVAAAMIMYILASFLFSAVREAYNYSSMHDNTSEVNSLPQDISLRSLEDLSPPTIPQEDFVCKSEERVHLEEASSVKLASQTTFNTPPTSRSEPVLRQADLDVFKRNLDTLSRAESVREEVVKPSSARRAHVTPPQRGRDPGGERDHWHFESSRELHIYIVRVHIIGAVLWGTITALDFSHPLLLTFFTTGMFVGVMLVHGESQSKPIRTSHNRYLASCGFLVYCVLFTVVVAVCFTQQTIDVHDVTGVFYYGVVCVFGVIWGVQFPSHKVVATAHAAYITTTLMSLPVLFLLTTLDDVKLLVHASSFSALYILVLEPLLKFLNVYVLILSVQANRGMEVSLILVTVLCVQLLYTSLQADRELEEHVMPVVSVCGALLFVIHLLREICS